MTATAGNPERHAEIREEHFRFYCEWNDLDPDDRDARHTQAFMFGHRAADDWDDAIHIAAPWEPRSSLCGGWNRNLVDLEDPRPNGVVGCWTCLMAAQWMDKTAAANGPPAPDGSLSGAPVGVGGDEEPAEEAPQDRGAPGGEAKPCGFCHGKPVGDAATWLDGKPRPPAPCPRCGEVNTSASAAPSEGEAST